MPLYEKLDDYQKDAVKKAIRRRSVCIFFEQGVGKTHPTVSIIEEFAQDEKFNGFLCVPLTNIETTWLTMLKKHIPHLNIARDWSTFKVLPFPRLLLIHYEGMVPIRKQVARVKWTFGCFDESQRLKARGTKASRIAASIKACEIRVALSGTPIDESPIDLFGQIRWVAPQLYGNDRSAWKHFDQDFLKPTGYMGYKRKFRADRLPIFLKEIAPYILRVEAKDVLDLPEVTTEMVPVEMLGEQRRVYRDMERDMVAFIEQQQSEASSLRLRAKELEEDDRDGEAEKLREEAHRISAGLKITMLVKLQQVCGGFVVDDEGELIKLPSAKKRKMKYLLKRKAKLPIAIFCKYTQERKDIEYLCDELHLSHAAIHGGIKDKKKKKLRTETINRFQSGKLDVIICQTKAGGVGVDLFRARSAAIYSTTFSFIDYDQCRKRVDRRGQVNETTLYYLYVKNTIDEDIHDKIVLKRSVSKSIFKQMKKRSLQNG